MAMISGMSVILYERTQTGLDDFNHPIYAENPVTIDNVLIAPASADDIINNVDLQGRKAIYTLAIPKGDTHKWTDSRVDFFGESWHVFGEPLEGMEHQIPLEWNKKVMVERYE